MLDKITFVKSICPTDEVIKYIGLYFDQMMLLYTILPYNVNYQVVGTNTDGKNFSVVISLADTSTASWFKSFIDLKVPFHMCNIYGRSLTVNTTLDNNLVTITIN